MPILFICPDCAATLRVPDNAGGRDTRCPKCGTALVVPESGQRSIEADLGGVWPQAENAKLPPKPEESGDARGILARLKAGLSAAAFIGSMRGDAESSSTASNGYQGRCQRAETPSPTSPFAPVAARGSTSTAGNSASDESADIKPMPNREPPRTPAVRSHPTSPRGNTVKPAARGFSAAVHPPEPTAERDDPVMNKEAAPTPDDPLGNLGSWGASLGLEAGAIKRVGDVEIALGYRFSTVYVPQNARGIAEGNMPYFDTEFVVGYRRPGDVFTLPTAGFIPVNGEPRKIQFASSDASIVKVYDDGSASFHQGGRVRITVRVAETTISISVTVVEFPLNAGMVPKDFGGNAASVEEVVRCLGLPDQRTHHFVASSAPKTIDGIYYGGDIAVEHWTYKKYRGAVIAIVGHSTNGWLWCVGTHRNS